jgi:DHA3 family tetracycline resistance protein-like MFS transporter
MWSGQTISRLGDSLYQVALAWWVVEKTGSALAMGLILIFTIVPMLAFLLLGGVMVDRWPRLPLLLASDVGRGVMVSVTALLAVVNWLEVWHLCLFGLLFGTVDAFFQPAYRAFVPEIVPPEELNSANSLGDLSAQLSGVLGPALGAGLVALGGTSGAFALDGLSFFISVACLLPLTKLALKPRPDESSRGMLGDLREGLGAVFGTPLLWITIGIAAISNITYAGPMEVALPFLIKNDLKAGVGVLGLFTSISSLGAILGAASLGQFTRLKRRGLLLYGAWLLIGLAVAAIGLPVGVPGLLLAGFIIGAFNSVLGIIWTNLLQEKVPGKLLGRVSSIDYLGSYLFLPVGLGLGGWATEWLGASWVFILGGLLSSGLVALGLCHPQIRRLN